MLDTGVMHIYFSGIGGVGIGPLAEIARDAGYKVSGSDLQNSQMVEQLRSHGVEVAIGQDGSHIALRHSTDPIDWFVYSSALPDDHPELAFAERRHIRISKRNELLAYIIDQMALSLVAVAGTHGKTTTTAMLIWLCRKLDVPASYSIGTTMSFGSSGHYDTESRFFFYEADEYDRNFLAFHPNLSLVTSADYDHPDTYPTVDEYYDAFKRFINQSQHVLSWPEVYERLGQQQSALMHSPKHSPDTIQLHGAHNRANAQLAVEAIHRLTDEPREKLEALIADFPGTGRRFEKLADNLYTDYGHHPAEIAATLQLARELNEHVVLVYQPHQNRRQHELRDQYTDCTKDAERVYWLSTYLTREDPDLEVLPPEVLIQHLENRENVIPAELNESLWQALLRERYEGRLVLVMGAGDIDDWLRAQLEKSR